MNEFVLDPRLDGDTIEIIRWPLSLVLLMNDARYPWLMLVPRRVGVSELTDLSDADQLQLHRESMALTQFMKTWFEAEKMNVASLGNVVAQLHVHHVARYQSDESWPAPVWGRGEAQRYTPEACQTLLAALKEALPTL